MTGLTTTLLAYLVSKVLRGSHSISGGTNTQGLEIIEKVLQLLYHLQGQAWFMVHLVRSLPSNSKVPEFDPRRCRDSNICATFLFA